MYTHGMQALLNYFSQFIFLTPLSATLLRLVVGAFYVYIGYRILGKRADIAHLKLPIVGHARPWMVLFSGFVTAIVGMMLFVGFLTQLAAILGALIAIKHFYLTRRYPQIGLMPRSTYVLLLAICLSLFMTGAGLYGFDLPLY